MKAFLNSLLCIAFIAGAVWVLVNRQQLVDMITVWQYQPSSEIAGLATRADMTDHGRFLFYATKPRLDTAETFNEVCERQEEGSAILGCYANGRIFIYDVDDVRLDGVKEVTAAHEMLHAAYDRLSNANRDQLAGDIERAYQQVEDDALRERMAYYARTEPGQRLNELYSILATEYAELPASLEEHYRMYFTNRQTVVNLHSQYSGRFAELAENTSSLRDRLEALSSEIANESSQYEASLDGLNARISQFNLRANGGYFSSRAQFESERGQLTQESDRLNQQRASINAKVEEYEQSRLRYNNLVDESNSMQQALDSSLAPAPSL